MHCLDCSCFALSMHRGGTIHLDTDYSAAKLGTIDRPCLIKGWDHRYICLGPTSGGISNAVSIESLCSLKHCFVSELFPAMHVDFQIEYTTDLLWVIHNQYFIDAQALNTQNYQNCFEVHMVAT